MKSFIKNIVILIVVAVLTAIASGIGETPESSLLIGSFTLLILVLIWIKYL